MQKVLPVQFDYAKMVGENIIAARKKAGISQTKLAAKVPMKQETLIYIEKGKRSPRINTLKSIADAIGCDIKDFL